MKLWKRVAALLLSISTMGISVLSAACEGLPNIFTSMQDGATSSSVEDSTSEKHTHEWSETVVLTATCTGKGLKIIKCDCGEERYEEILALDHAYEDEITKAPTCEEGGVKTFTCANGCGASYTEEIPEFGHNYDDGVITTQPTCDTEGVKTYTCANGCGGYTVTVPELKHAYDEGKITTPATCEEKGVKTYTCENGCGSYTEEIPELGHAYDDGEITTPPTCTTEGEKTYTCANGCDGYTVTVPKAEHNFENGICTNEGCGIGDASKIVAPRTDIAGFDGTYLPTKEIARQQGVIDVVLVFEGTVKGWEALAAEYSRLHGGEVVVNLNATYTDAKVYQQNLMYELASSNPTWDIIQGNFVQGGVSTYCLNMGIAVHSENPYAGKDLLWKDVLTEDAYIDWSGATNDMYIMNSEGLETAWFINMVALDAARAEGYTGADNPKTWNELMELCFYMEKAGYKNPLGIALDDASIDGGQFRWLLDVYGDYFYRNEYPNIMMDENMFKYDPTETNPEGDIFYGVNANKFFYSIFVRDDENYYVGPESEKFQEFIENFQKMRPYLRPNSAQASLSALRADFATQSKGKDSPQIFLDYFGAGLKFQQNQNTDFQLDFFDYPIMESDMIEEETILRDVGGAGSGLSIVAQSVEQNALSLDFMRFVMSPYGQSIYYEALNKEWLGPMGMTTVVNDTVAIPQEWKTFFANDKIVFNGTVNYNPYLSFLIRDFQGGAQTTAQALVNWKKYLTSETFTTDDFVASWGDAMERDWFTYCAMMGWDPSIRNSREGHYRL